MISAGTAHGNKDLNQIFSEPKTYFILSLGLLCLLFIYFLGGLILLILGFHEYGECNLIRNTPTSTIRSAPMGRVEVIGSAKPLSEEFLLESPFAGEECLAYSHETMDSVIIRYFTRGFNRIG